MVEYLSRDYIVHRMVHPSTVNEDRIFYPSTTSIKPKFSIRKERNRGVVLCFEESNSQSIRIYGKRGTEENFSVLAEIPGLYYIDERRNLFEAPEIREYMARYINEGKETGEASDVVLIINK